MTIVSQALSSGRMSPEELREAAIEIVDGIWTVTVCHGADKFEVTFIDKGELRLFQNHIRNLGAAYSVEAVHERRPTTYVEALEYLAEGDAK